MPSREEVVELLSALVAINSVNPSLVPGAAGEGEIGQFIADWLRGAGLQVDLQEVEPGRPNVIGRLSGGSGRALVLNAHVDTVGVAGMERAFEPRVEGDRVYGRGAYDMKGSLAAIMLAAQRVARLDSFGGELIITAVADEEYASLGTQAFLRDHRADAAVVTEPTGMRICTAHKGFAWLAIETAGTAAHGSKPEFGVDAIAHMGRVLRDVENLGDELRGGVRHPLLGTGSIHASLIDGGQELSSYPERCRLQVERRTVPGEGIELVMTQVEDRLRLRSAEDPTFRATASLILWRDPFEVGQDEPIVRSLEREVTAVVGKPPEIYGDTPWMDAALFAGAGIPTVVFGPGGAGAHAVIEYSHIGEVAASAEVFARLAVDFC